MIRDFEPRDQDAFRQQVQAGMRDRWGDEFDPSANPDVDDVWASYVVAKQAVVVVAEIDKTIVGTGILVRDDPVTGRLLRMSVDVRHRRKGVATALVRELVTRAAGSGMRTVVVKTDTIWADAVALYRSCGFEIFNQGEETNFVLPLDSAAVRPSRGP